MSLDIELYVVGEGEAMNTMEVFNTFSRIVVAKDNVIWLPFDVTETLWYNMCFKEYFSGLRVSSSSSIVFDVTGVIFIINVDSDCAKEVILDRISSVSFRDWLCLYA